VKDIRIKGAEKIFKVSVVASLVVLQDG